MFDVGFSELVLVAIVALLVLGPERLPKVARVAGMWVGRARRTLSSVKQEIDRELKAEELKRVLEEQARANPLETLVEDWRNTTADPAPVADTTPGPSETSPSSHSSLARDKAPNH
jgi:sec-independent protein translocase protein TatB